MQETCYINTIRGHIPSALDYLLLLLDVAVGAGLYSEVPTVVNMRRRTTTLYII